MRIPPTQKEPIWLLSWEQSIVCSKMAAAPGNPSYARLCCNIFTGAPPPGPGLQGSLPAAKHIINLGVMPDCAFAGHPTPRTPLAPRTLCQTMAVTEEERTRLLCLVCRKLLGGSQQWPSSHSLPAEPTESPGLPRGQAVAIAHLDGGVRLWPVTHS